MSELTSRLSLQLYNNYLRLLSNFVSRYYISSLILNRYLCNFITIFTVFRILCQNITSLPKSLLINRVNNVLNPETVKLPIHRPSTKKRRPSHNHNKRNIPNSHVTKKPLAERSSVTNKCTVNAAVNWLSYTGSSLRSNWP